MPVAKGFEAGAGQPIRTRIDAILDLSLDVRRDNRPRLGSVDSFNPAFMPSQWDWSI